MNKHTIAEILHYAADNKLSSKQSEYWLIGGNKEKYSCCAVEYAIFDLCSEYLSYNQRSKFIVRVKEGLKEMGCPISSTNAFNDSGSYSSENQQARYTWLKFAATIAEEQGV